MARKAGTGLKVVGQEPDDMSDRDETDTEMFDVQGTVGTQAGDDSGSISNGGGPSDDLVMKFVAQLDVQQVEIDRIDTMMKSATKGRKSIRGQAKAAGVPLAILDAAMKKRDLARHKQRENLEWQDRLDGLLGNETWEDADLFAKETDQHVKDEVDWEKEGYGMGKRALPLKVPDNCPPEFVQALSKGHEKGADALAASLGGEKYEPVLK